MILMKESVLVLKKKQQLIIGILLSNSPQVLMTFMTNPLNIIFDDFGI